jgi:membrane protein implicated in regulation of membrane protease activity
MDVDVSPASSKMPTFIRYLLLQLPGILALLLGLLVARRWIDLSTGVVVAVTAAWIVKDLALYPLLRRAYEVDPRNELERLLGDEATVTTPLEPGGLVTRRGVLWRAEAAPGEPVPIASGSRVRIERHRGLVLVVRATREDDATHGSVSPPPPSIPRS